jgi:hypothetical protein
MEEPPSREREQTEFPARAMYLNGWARFDYLSGTGVGALYANPQMKSRQKFQRHPGYSYWLILRRFAPAKAQRRKETKKHFDFDIFSWRLCAFAGNSNQTAPLPRYSSACSNTVFQIKDFQ